MSREDDLAECERLLAELEKEHDREARKADKHRARAANLSREIADARARLRALQIPEEPADGSVIRFVKRYQGSIAGPYVFVAHRKNELWWATGRTGPEGVRWPRLVEFIRRDNLAPFGFEILTSRPPQLSTTNPPF